MNKYYGFTPFVFSTANSETGLLYDLLKGDVHQVPAHFVNIFNKKYYTAYEELSRKCAELKVRQDELDQFLKEGIEGGLILEFPQAYWRNEVKTPLEIGFRSEEKQIPGEFYNVWLQPTSKCDMNCTFCNKHLNCVCKSDNHDNEWSERQLENLLSDLWRYKGRLLGVNIYGGNPLLYPGLERLLSGLSELNPLSIKLVLPALSATNSFKDKLLELLGTSGSNILISYIIYANYWDLEQLIDLILPKSEIILLYDSDLENDIDTEALEKRGFYVDRKNILKADSSNIQWYKKRINEDFFEALEYNEFFFRAHLHRCWGCSFAINSIGEVKPCLWSDQVFSSWEDGKISQIFMDDPETRAFYLENSLESIEGCKDCIYRYGCKDCRVTSEFLAKKRKTKNPLCSK